ncbi:MAG: phage holin family protein [Clostridium butyricum]|nr:phage holin family protein [Clostridium butyricum]
MENLIYSLAHNIFIKIAIWAILLDTFLGGLRALRHGKFNSSVGIDGGIRKVAMMGCLAFLAILDTCFTVNLLFMIPQEWISVLGVKKLGISEFFAILFILYEAASILKNMLLCGLPIPKKWREKLEGFLNLMTDELTNIKESK